MSSFATTTRLRVLRRPAQDLSVLVLVPLPDEAARPLERRGRRARASLLARLPAPLPVVAHVVRHVLRTLENAPRKEKEKNRRKEENHASRAVNYYPASLYDPQGKGGKRDSKYFLAS